MSGLFESSALLGAAERGDAEAVRQALADGGDPAYADGYGWTALHWVAENGMGEFVDTMVELGAIVDGKCAGERTPLCLAADEGHLDVARKLLSHGASVEELDEDGFSALHRACSSGNPDLVKLLLDHGSNPSLKSNISTTPLHITAKNNDPDASRLLLEAGADPNACDAMGNNALLWATINGDFAGVAEVVIEGGAAVDEGLRDFAVEKGRVGVAAVLLRAIEQRKEEEETFGPPEVFEHAAAGRGSLLMWLLDERDVAPNCVDRQGRTPLFEAVANDQVGSVEILLERGADPNRRDADGMPISWAFGPSAEHEGEIKALLREYGWQE